MHKTACTAPERKEPTVMFTGFRMLLFVQTYTAHPAIGLSGLTLETFTAYVTVLFEEARGWLEGEINSVGLDTALTGVKCISMKMSITETDSTLSTRRRGIVPALPDGAVLPANITVEEASVERLQSVGPGQSQSGHTPAKPSYWIFSARSNGVNPEEPRRNSKRILRETAKTATWKDR